MRDIICLRTVGLLVAAFILLSMQLLQAASITDITVTCQYVTVSGKTEVNTSYVRVQVVLGSDLTQVLSQQVVKTRPRAGASYRAKLKISQAHLAEGTHVVIAVGEWDGTKYLRPATLTGADCGTTNAVTPTPAAK